jgi:hypothetical protein
MNGKKKSVNLTDMLCTPYPGYSGSIQNEYSLIFAFILNPAASPANIARYNN